MFEVFIYTLTALSIGSSFLALLPFPKWWFRIFEVIQPYLAFTALICIILLLLLQGLNGLDTLLICILLFNFLNHLKALIPYSPLVSPEIKLTAQDSNDLIFLVANILNHNQNINGFIQVVERHQPDILLLIEYTPYWDEHLPKALPLYPHFIGHAVDSGFGIAIYSKFPLIDPSIKFLVDPKIPSIHTQMELPCKPLQKVNLVGTHPSPTVPWTRGTTIEKDLEVFKIAELIQKNNAPFIVAGDFNDVGWSAAMIAFKKAAGLVDPRVGRGLFNTFHANNPFINYPIDHIFVSKHFHLTQFKRIKLKGSDHHSLLAGLAIGS